MQCPQVVGALDEIAQAELAFVENLETDPVPARQALGSELHAQMVDLIGGHIHGAAAGGNLMRNVLGLQLADDGRGVLLSQSTIEQLIVGAAGPEDERDESGDDHRGSQRERNPLGEAELFPEGKQ